MEEEQYYQEEFEKHSEKGNDGTENATNNFFKSNNIQSSSEAKNFSNNEEITTLWELEVWKKAEQTKFKAYLKQLEIEYMQKISEDFKRKEEEREKQIKQTMNELSILHTRLKKKANDLEGRENKLVAVEQELKLKVGEISKQLANKDEEIALIKKKFKDEKTMLEKDKQNLQKIIGEKEKENLTIESAFRSFRKEVDESPLSIMRAEINKKNMEIDELNREKERILSEKDKFRQQCEKLKLDMIKMKKSHENDKEILFKQKIDEVEKLKFEIQNQRMSQIELQELNDLREKLKRNNNATQIEEKKEEHKKNKEYQILNSRKNINKENNTEGELERLINEKNNLIKSGMYNEKDVLIIKLDNQIKKIIESK